MIQKLKQQTLRRTLVQAVLFVLLLPLTAVFICGAVGYVQDGRFRFARWQNFILYVSVAALTIFGVVRNLVRFL